MSCDRRSIFGQNALDAAAAAGDIAVSKPAGPLPQGTHTLGGSFFALMLDYSRRLIGIVSGRPAGPLPQGTPISGGFFYARDARGSDSITIEAA